MRAWLLSLVALLFLIRNSLIFSYYRESLPQIRVTNILCPPRWANRLFGAEFSTCLFGLCVRRSGCYQKRCTFTTYGSLMFQKLRCHLSVNYDHSVDMPGVVTDHSRMSTFNRCFLLKQFLLRQFRVDYIMMDMGSLIGEYRLDFWD